MSEFVEYKRFTDADDTVDLTVLLDRENIPYKIEDHTIGFVVFGNNDDPYDNQVILKVPQDLIGKIDALWEEASQRETIKEEDHYLYTFSDKDIIDIIANQNEWSRFEVNLAQKIAKDRNLEITSQLLKNAKTSSKEKKRIAVTFEGLSGWFQAISTLNFALALLEISKLKINFYVLQTYHLLLNSFQRFGYEINSSVKILLALALSLPFMIIWSLARRGSKKAYVVGFVLYCLDAVIAVKDHSGFSIGFHVFIILILTPGLSSNKQEHL